MKNKTTLTLLVAVLLLVFTACHHRHTNKIVMNDNDTYLKFEYSGQVMLTEDKTAIESVSPNGHLTLKYTKDDKKLIAQSDRNGNVHYKVYHDGERLNFDSEGKALLQEAIQKLTASHSVHFYK